MDQNHYCYFPLNQNEAVRYWQLSAISSQRYDVPNAPMSVKWIRFSF